jgi:hypothetical protein
VRVDGRRIKRTTTTVTTPKCHGRQNFLGPGGEIYLAVGWTRGLLLFSRDPSLRWEARNPPRRWEFWQTSPEKPALLLVLFGSLDFCGPGYILRLPLAAHHPVELVQNPALKTSLRAA